MLESQGSPKDLEVFSPHWNPEEAGSTTSEEDDLANEKEDKEAESKSFPLSCPFMWAATRRHGSYLGGIKVYIGELIPLNLSGFRIAIAGENLTKV